MLWVRLALGLVPTLAVLLLGFSLRGGIAGAVARAQDRADAQVAAASSQATVRVAAETAQAQTEIRWRTKVIHDATPLYITPEADRRCDLPNGFVRLHDAAALGQLPGPPAATDAAPSGLAPSDAAGVIVDNYGACHAAIDQLTRLQGWIRDQQAVYGGVR